MRNPPLAISSPMTMRLLLVATLLIAWPAAARGQALTWVNCPRPAFAEVPGTKAQSFQCVGKHDYLLFGTLRPDRLLNGVTAVRFELDMLDEDAAALPPYWHYEAAQPAGCNHDMVLLMTTRFASTCGAYVSPWAAAGELALTLDFVPDPTRANRGHFIGRIGAENPVQLVAGRDYLLFFLFFSTYRANVCPGCTDRATVVWGRTVFSLSDGSSVTLTETPDFCVTINGGSACAATPVRNGTWAAIKRLYR